MTDTHPGGSASRIFLTTVVLPDPVPPAIPIIYMLAESVCLMYGVDVCVHIVLASSLSVPCSPALWTGRVACIPHLQS